MRILLIEDEEKVSNFIGNGLREESYAVDIALDGLDGLEMAFSSQYDLVILDLTLPGCPGLEVLQRIRRKKVFVPVLILTAKHSVEEKVRCLDSGGDDYLTKPFSFDELLARIRALFRRSCQKNQHITLRIGDLVLDPSSHQVMRGGKRVNLTAKEYALLEYLMRNTGRILNRSQIAEHVWNLDFDSYTNVIDVHINHLRRKIDDGCACKLINTVRGMGYIIDEGEK